MSDWFQPEYILSGVALLVALIALWFGWSSARQANDAADAAEASKHAAERSARAATQSSKLALEFVDLPLSRWLETKTALLCIQDLRRNAVSSHAPSTPASPGFTFGLRNRGKAAAEARGETSFEEYSEGTIVGTPEEIRDRARANMDLGFNYFIMSFP